MRPEDKRCGNCRFFIHEAANLQMGNCHALPPTGVLIPGPKGPMNASFFSPVKAKDWCGKHEPRFPMIEQPAGEA